jgi:hypothetical protein
MPMAAEALNDTTGPTTAYARVFPGARSASDEGLCIRWRAVGIREPLTTS